MPRDDLLREYRDTRDFTRTPEPAGDRRDGRHEPIFVVHTIFTHCLPMGRGEEAAVQVAEGPRSVVGKQAANRVPIEEAAINALVTGARDAPAQG